MSEPNYHPTNIFSDNLLAIGIRRMWILMIKAVYLDLSALEIRKIAMYEFWHDYIKKKKILTKSKITIHGYSQLYS